MSGHANFLSQPEVDALLKGVTGEVEEPQAAEAPDDWAAAMAGLDCSGSRQRSIDAQVVKAVEKMANISRFEFLEKEPSKPLTWIQLIDKLQYEIEQADRDMQLILERRTATYDILQDILRVAP